MAYSFTKIEAERSNVIKYGTGLLVFFYFLSLWTFLFLLRLCFYDWFVVEPPGGLGAFEVILNIRGFTLMENIVIFILAVIVGALHFEISTRELVPKIMRLLRARLPDPQNFRHAQFLNILEELSVACGGAQFAGFIIPSRSINAFAVADFQGRKAIGVTQGLLGRLSRPQTEAVCAHEAAHLIKGDALDATVLLSLFNVPSEILKDMNIQLDNTAVYAARFSMKGIMIFSSLWIMLGLSKTVGTFFNMFLSREREYRADAIAVRLTRNSRPLAEALYKASFFWHGAGTMGEYLSPIFIVRPRYDQFKEGDGFWARLFSTHPPLRRRLGVLLNMAHISSEEFESEMALDKDIVLEKALERARKKEEWMVRIDNEWQGPFDQKTLSEKDVLHPETLVKRIGHGGIVIAGADKKLKEVAKFNKLRDGRNIFCPKCYRILKHISYGGFVALECPQCEGVLLKGEYLKELLKKRIVEWRPEIIEAAKLLSQERIGLGLDGRRELYSHYRYICPNCQNYQKRMQRNFYSPTCLVEIDKCLDCHALWLDKDELEILQYLSDAKAKEV